MCVCVLLEPYGARARTGARTCTYAQTLTKLLTCASKHRWLPGCHGSNCSGRCVCLWVRVCVRFHDTPHSHQPASFSFSSVLHRKKRFSSLCPQVRKRGRETRERERRRKIKNSNNELCFFFCFFFQGGGGEVWLRGWRRECGCVGRG